MSARPRLLAGALTAAVLSSFVVGTPASAAPSLPAGATTKSPAQARFDPRPGAASGAGADSAPPSSTPKRAPGAVGPETKHPDPVLPKGTAPGPQRVAALRQQVKTGGGKTASSRELTA